MKESKCIGILGWMFGHKFKDTFHIYRFCLRCGTPAAATQRRGQRE